MSIDELLKWSHWFLYTFYSTAWLAIAMVTANLFYKSPSLKRWAKWMLAVSITGLAIAGGFFILGYLRTGC